MLRQSLALSAAAFCFSLAMAAAPVVGPFEQVAYAGPGGGSGPGADGPGAAGAGAQGAETSQAAQDQSHHGVEHAEDVVVTTPAEEHASAPLSAAAETQAAGQEPEDESDMSFSQAMENMAADAQAAMNAIFGRSE